MPNARLMSTTQPRRRAATLAVASSLALATLVAQTPAGANDSGPSGPAAATGNAAPPAQTAATGIEPSGDAVDCSTGATVPAGGLGADISGVVAGVTGEGDLLLRVLVHGDPPALASAGLFSLAYEVAFTIPSTGARLIAYDQRHDGGHEAKVVDERGRVVAGTEVDASYVSLGESTATAREVFVYDSAGRPTGRAELDLDPLLYGDDVGGFVELRVHNPKLRPGDVTAAPMPLQATTYWMETEHSGRYCDRLERRDIPVVLVDGSGDEMELFGFPLSAATTAATSTPASTASATTAPAAAGASQSAESAAAVEGADGPPALHLLLWILALVGLLAGFLSWWRSRGREARAADCLERVFDHGVSVAPDPGASAGAPTQSESGLDRFAQELEAMEHPARVPWAGDYWAEARDDIDYRWDGADGSPTEKVERAFGVHPGATPDVK